MRFGYSEACLAHDTGDRHPEAPDRLRAIVTNLEQLSGIEYVDAAPTTTEELASVHGSAYLESIREFCESGGGTWDPDTVAVPETWDAATASAGLARWAASAGVTETPGPGTPFALGRPPGHHAVANNAMGFCFINNVAVAAELVLRAGDAEAVAIFDWDVHHGNGTQEIFYERGDVLYASIHEHGLYPGTGGMNEVGDDDGAGATVNIPLPAGAGNQEYRAVLTAVIEPKIEDLDPDLILVSAGFDAHKQDPISRMRLTTNGYGMLADRIKSLASRLDAGLGFVLEGGYSLEKLANSVRMVYDVFEGQDPGVPDGDPNTEVGELIERIREIHGLGSK